MIQQKKTYDIKEIIKPGWKLDKVKLKYTVRKKEEIQNIINHIEFDTRVLERYESNNFKACRMNYLIRTKEGNLYIGIGSNQPNLTFDEQMKTIIIEYNPNKLDAFKIAPYLKDLLLLDIHRREILSLDLAYDMFINISELKYTKRRINEYECRISHENLETVYLRKMGQNGSVRIYDKTLEMNGGTNEDVEEETGEIFYKKYTGDCTRYEIRIKPGKLKLAFNLINPWLLSELVNLHKLEIKEKGQDEKILEKIYEYNGNDFTNLLAVHIGAERKINKRAKKKYKEIYENIKKEISSNKDTSIFKDFNTDKMFKIIIDYLEHITIKQHNQLIFPRITENTTRKTFRTLMLSHIKIKHQNQIITQNL